jgi:hypothetical protein
MGPWAWLVLLAWSAALATAANYMIFRTQHKPTDYDWTFIAGGALLGGFTAHVWYPGFGPRRRRFWPESRFSSKRGRAG